jgi:beta-N-acetylhexosaminidase
MVTIPAAIGRRFIVGITGSEMSATERELFGKLRPGGIILRAPNVLEKVSYEIWRGGLQALIESAHEAAGRDRLLVAIDHEGGRVHRLPAPITHFPPPIKWPQHARAVAEAMGTELRSLGFNVVFGPVADIHSNLDNPVIGTRSFGSDPNTVATAVVEAMHGYRAAGIVPVAKHFPGHGDTHQDSHELLPYLPHALSKLLSRELVPFQRICASGFPCIMTAHILFPELDAAFPATLSGRILRGILRDLLGFKGIVVTDDCDMKAITNQFPDSVVAERLFPSGVDLGLFNHDLPRAVRIAEETTTLATRSEGFRAALEERNQAIEDFFHSTLCTSSFSALDQSTLSKHQHLLTLVETTSAV